MERPARTRIEAAWIAGIVLTVLLAFALLFSRSLASGGEERAAEVNRTIARITHLSRESRVQGQECAAVLATIRRETEQSARREFFVTRSSALRALGGARRFMGTPLATAEALELFLGLPQLPGGTALDELELGLAGLSDCQATQFYGVLTRLIHPRTRRLLDVGQQEGVRRTLLAYLYQESSTGPRFFPQAELLIRLLERGIRDGLLVGTPASRTGVDALMARSAKIRAEKQVALARLEASRSQAGREPRTETERRADLDELADQVRLTDDLLECLADLVERELDELNRFPAYDGTYPLLAQPSQRVW
jgi:hypothetical protein